MIISYVLFKTSIYNLYKCITLIYIFDLINVINM